MGAIGKILSGQLEEDFLRHFRVANLLSTSLLVAGALVFSTPRTAWGILAGAVIATLNCIGLERDCFRVIRMKTVFAYYGGLAVRLALITLAVTVVFFVFPWLVSPVGLFIGLSVAVLNFYVLVIGVLVKRLRAKEAV